MTGASSLHLIHQFREESDTAVLFHQAIMLYAAVSTITKAVRPYSPDETVRLLAQDPQYTDNPNDLLKGKELEVV